MNVVVRDAAPDDITWASAWMDRELGTRMQAGGGELVDALSFAAVDHHRGAGSALLDAVVARLPATCRRLWLITINDNVDALRFYQRRGFRITAFHAGAADDARERRKPALPVDGYHGIPLHDELELERPL
jgi:GNAT superfamily N-acetyltransferase